MMANASGTMAPALDRRRYPHVWSWGLKLVEEFSLPSIAVELLGLLVKWSALLDSNKTLDVQSFASFLDCCHPRAKDSLCASADLLAHNLAILVLLESCGSVPRLVLGDLTGKEMTPCQLCRDWLLLHGPPCLHGRPC